MTQIAVLTPDPQDKSYIGRWPEVLARLTAVLQDTGARVVATPGPIMWRTPRGWPRTI